MRKKILFFLASFLFVFVLSAQTKNERLDNNFGFREFKLKTPKENYATYGLKRNDFYKMPDIVEVYSLPYDMTIGNTKMEELHLFFLGNRLVRVTAMLKDSLQLSYLKKSFGSGEVPSITVKLDDKMKQDIAQGIVQFAYTPIWSWNAETVRFEEKWIYLCDNKSCIRKMCLDLYLVDFQDLMKSLFN
jgi:hypothetical protein